MEDVVLVNGAGSPRCRLASFPLRKVQAFGFALSSRSFSRSSSFPGNSFPHDGEEALAAPDLLLDFPGLFVQGTGVGKSVDAGLRPLFRPAESYSRYGYYGFRQGEKPARNAASRLSNFSNCPQYVGGLSETFRPYQSFQPLSGTYG